MKPPDDSAGADDWLSSLAVPSKATTTSNGLKTPGSASTAAKPAKSAKQQDGKGRFGRGIAAALAGVLGFGRKKLGWFNTTKRKIVGAVGGTALLAAVAGLASLPLLLHSKPVPQQIAAVPPKLEEKKPPVEDDVGPPPDKSTEKKPDTSSESPEKDGSGEAAEPPKKPKHRPEKPLKSADLDKTAQVPRQVPRQDSRQVPGQDQRSSGSKAGRDPRCQTGCQAVPPVNKPEPPAKPVSLDGLLAAVDLPLPGKSSNETVSLGKLDLDPKLTVDVSLLGGDLVAKGKSKFELQKEGDATTPGWSVQMTAKNKDPLKIARVWRDGSDWKMQWVDEVQDKTTLDKAAPLRCCGLQFSCGKASPHLVALIAQDRSTAVDRHRPVPARADRQGRRHEHFSRDFPLPDPGLLRLQILPLDKSLPKHDIKILEAKAHGGRSPRGRSMELAMGDTVPAKGQVIVAITKEKTPRVEFDITFDTRGKDALVDMAAACELWGREVPFNMNALQRLSAEVGAVPDGQSGRRQGQERPQQSSAEQTQAANMVKDQLKALAELSGELNRKASIPFRIYAVLGETDDKASPRVVIFQSGEVEDQQAGTTKKNPKGPKAKGRIAPDADELKLK